MKKHVQKIYRDHGFGFPVILLNVPMVEVRGEKIPNVDQKELQELVIDALVHKSSRLTGNEIHFIRLYARMNLEQFAERFAVSHPAVLKWENVGHHATSMNWTTEKDIRLFALSLLGPKPQTFVGAYEQLADVAHERAEPIKVDLKKTA